jgi:protocatechuate 3,4-dioxygenase beta subunit
MFSSILSTALLLVTLTCAESAIATPRYSSARTKSISSDNGPDTFSAVGRVIDAVTGQPIGGAHFVYGRPAKNTNNGGFVTYAIAQTNKLGEFRLSHLNPGHYALYISASVDRSDLYSDVVNFDIVDADIANVEVQARHGSKLTGWIVPAGVTNAATLERLASVKLVASVPSIGSLRVGISNVTNILPDGSFEVKGLRPGKVFVNLKADNDMLNGLSILRIERSSGEVKQGFEIKSGEDMLDLRIIIADGTGVIRGQVKVGGGSLPDGARISASISNQLRFANGYADVDQDGHFTISGLAPGTYQIALNAYNPPPHQGVRLAPTLIQSVKVTDANESVVAFTIKLPPN